VTDLEASGPAADDIPVAVLEALSYRKHAGHFSDPDDLGHIHGALGQDDSVLYAIDDGDACMICRLVGRSSDGCTYSLVARISLFAYADLRDGSVALVDAFADARELALCGVYQEAGVVANVLVVQRYRRVEKVPPEYLPPAPFINFAAVDPDDE
jgi:hypothetical protein